MSVRVAINGFGRIGRAVFRIIAERPDSGIEVVAINDLADDDVLAYLLKNDTVMGQFAGEVQTADGIMTAGGHTVQMLMEPDPTKLPLGRAERGRRRRGHRHLPHAGEGCDAHRGRRPEGAPHGSGQG